jgi:hypothetical protein
MPPSAPAAAWSTEKPMPTLPEIVPVKFSGGLARAFAKTMTGVPKALAAMVPP